MRKGLMITVSLLLVSGLILIGACGAGETERTVIKEVPVEKGVEREVIKQKSASSYDYQSSGPSGPQGPAGPAGAAGAKGDAGSPVTISGSSFEEGALTIDRSTLRKHEPES